MNSFYLSRRTFFASLCLLLGAALLCGCEALGLGDKGEETSFRSADSDDRQWALFSDIVRDYRQFDREYNQAKQNNDIKKYKELYMWYGKRLITHALTLQNMSGEPVVGYKDELLMLNALSERSYDLRGALRIAKRPAGQQITDADKKLWEEEYASKQQLIEALTDRCAPKYGGYLLWKGKTEKDVLLCYEDLALDNGEELLQGARGIFYELLDSRGAEHLSRLQRLKIAFKRKFGGSKSVRPGSPEQLTDSKEEAVWFSVNYLAVSADNYLCAVKYKNIKKTDNALTRHYNEAMLNSLSCSRGRIAAAGVPADDSLLTAAKGLCRAVEILQAADKQWRSGAVKYDGYIQLVDQRAAVFEKMRALTLCARRDYLLRQNGRDAKAAAKLMEADGIAASTAEHIPDLPPDFARQVSSLEAKPAQ